MNGYICFYNGKKFECQAKTQLEARDKAVEHFRAHKKPWMVSAVLVEKSGQQVVTDTNSL